MVFYVINSAGFDERINVHGGTLASIYDLHIQNFSEIPSIAI
jgi:hypothetical protein